MQRPRKPREPNLAEQSKNEDPKKVYKSVVKFKNPSGWTYVREVSSVYDPKIQNKRPIKYNTLGKLPPGETDIAKMIPIGNRGRKKNNEVLDGKTKSFLKPLQEVKSESNLLRSVYPLQTVILVAIVAAMFKKTDCDEIAQFWKVSRPLFEKYYPHFPESDISQGTVRNLIAMLCRQENASQVEEYAGQLLDKLRRSIEAIGGSRNEMVKASYFFNIFEANNEVILTYELIDAKSNKIKKAVEAISGLNIEGTIVVCDAFDTQRRFAETICTKGADYLFELTENQGALFDHVQALFELRKDFKSAKTLVEHRSEKVDSRDLKVLPAKLLIARLNEKWIGLEEGCIVQAITRSANKETGVSKESIVRYYITSLRYDTPYISEVLIRIVIRHWTMAKKSHWNLDVLLDQDRLPCKNGEFLAGSIALNKIGLKFRTRIQEMLEVGDQSLAKQEIQSGLRSPEEMLELLFSDAE